MPGAPCAFHPQESTLVQCGRCGRPICVRCMVDTPVGKKCRECARSRSHLSESTPGQVAAGFLVAAGVAVPVAWALLALPLWILAFPYGALIGEAALRAGGRRRSTAMQIAAGVAAALGPLAGALLPAAGGMGGLPAASSAVLGLWPFVLAGIGAATAVSRVRFL